MGWNVTAAAPGTSCRVEGQSAAITRVAAFRVNDEGETHVLIAPHQEPPEWVPLERLEMLSAAKGPN